MKRFWVAIVFCFMLLSFLAACATTASDRKGYGGKKSMPKEASEEVVSAPTK